MGTHVCRAESSRRVGQDTATWAAVAVQAPRPTAPSPVRGLVLEALHPRAADVLRVRDGGPQRGLGTQNLQRSVSSRVKCQASKRKHTQTKKTTSALK